MKDQRWYWTEGPGSKPIIWKTGWIWVIRPSYLGGRPR